MENNENKNGPIVTGETLMKMKIKDLPYLVQGLIPKTSMVALAGSSDTGKSSLLRQLASAISSGDNDFLGFKLNIKHGRVLYISTEDDSFAMAYLLDKYNSFLRPEQLKNLFFLFDTEDYFVKIENILKVTPVDAIIIDTFTDLYGGEMNSTNKIRSYLNQYSTIATRFDCATIFLHHTGKRTEDLIPSKSNLLGSQGFEAKMRLVLELRRDFDQNHLRHLCIVKGNYVPDKEKEMSYVLDFKEFYFRNTGKRVPFVKLIKGYETKQAESNELVSKICQLRKENKTAREISKILNDSGIHVGKSRVGELMKQCPSVHPSLTDTDAGQVKNEAQDDHDFKDEED